MSELKRVKPGVKINIIEQSVAKIKPANSAFVGAFQSKAKKKPAIALKGDKYRISYNGVAIVAKSEAIVLKPSIQTQARSKPKPKPTSYPSQKAQ